MWVCYCCPVCETLIWGNYGEVPICLSKKCTEIRYKEIIKEVGERRDFLAGELQFYTESIIKSVCVLYVNLDSTVSFSLVDDQESDKTTDVVFDIS